MAGRLTEFKQVDWIPNANNPRPDNNSEKAPGLGQPWWNRGRTLSRSDNYDRFDIDNASSVSGPGSSRGRLSGLAPRTSVQPGNRSRVMQ